jgi:hypothetical protein
VGNVERFLREVPERNTVSAIITLNNLSVTSLRELLKGILYLRRQYSHSYQRILFDTPLLRVPEWQSLQILPPDFARQMADTADWMELNLATSAAPNYGFSDYEVERIRRAIAWMREGKNIDTQEIYRRRADFYRFFNEHDLRRGTNFLKTFPEMYSWWNECKYHASK